MKFRLILDGARNGALNMAIDEMLMDRQRVSDAPPVLRIYTWEEPCYTLGYFQSVEEQRKRIPQDIRLIRRITGGGLVCHDRDVTFSLTLKELNPFFPKDVKTSYLKINEALRHGLRTYFPELEYADCKTVPSIGQRMRHSDARICFEAPACYDLLLNGTKVVGASQRRKGGLLLHQSSVQLTSSHENIIAGIVRGFREKWVLDFQEEPLSERELALSRQTEEDRYSNSEWAAAPVSARV